MSATILPLFGQLASTESFQRLEASAKLVSHLSSEAGSDDLDYALKRLVRGLASSRESARVGFSVALAELLQRNADISPSNVLELLFSSSAVPANAKTSEEKDLAFARLFGIHALFRSGAVFRPRSAQDDEEDEEDGLKLWTEATTELWQLSQKKAWMRESVGWVLVDAVRGLLGAGSAKGKGKAKAVDEDAAIRGLVERAFRRNKAWSLEKVALAACLQDSGVAADWSALLGPTFPDGNILAARNLPTLVDILKGHNQGPEGKTGLPAPTSESGKPHFVYQVVVDSVASSPEGKIDVADLTESLVEDWLLAPTTTTTARKRQGLLIVDLVLRSSLPTDVLARVLTPHVLGALAGQLKSKDRTLHRLAHSVVESLHAAAKRSPDLALAFANRFLAFDLGFDQRTGTKTVQGLVGRMDGQGIESWTTALIKVAKSSGPDPAVEEDSDDDPGDSLRRAAFDQLGAVVRSHGSARAPASLKAILTVFATGGFFVALKKKRAFDPPLSTRMQEMARAKFFTSLAELASRTGLPADEPNGEHRAPGFDPSGRPWVSVAFELFWHLRESKGLEAIVDEPEGMAEQRQVGLRTREIVAKEESDGARTMATLAEALLLASMDRGSDVGPLFELLEACAPGLADPASHVVVDDAMDEDGEPVEPIDAFVELALEVLQRPFVLLRTVTEQAFAVFADRLKRESLQLVLDVVLPVETGPDEQNGVEEEEDGEEDEEDEEEDEDEEEQESSAEWEDVSHDGEDEIDGAFRDKIAAALGVDLEAGATSEEEEDVLLDDEQMFALDDNLAELFRRQAGKSNSREARTDVLHYKLRVLSLVESFAKCVPTSALLPMLVLPLLHVAQRADREQSTLQAKAVRILRDYVCTSKPAIDPVADAAQAVELPDILRLVHGIARSASAKDIADACSRASLWLARALEPETATVGEVYVATIVDYVTRKASSVRPGMVAEFLRQRPGVAWEVREEIASAVLGETVNTFRAVQALSWLQSLLKSHLGPHTEACKASLLTFMPSIRTKVLAKLDGSTAVPVAYVKELLKFAMACMRLTQRCTSIPGALTAVWPTEDVEAAVVALRVGAGTKDAKAVQLLAKQARAMVEWRKPYKKGKRKRVDEEADGKKKPR